MRRVGRRTSSESDAVNYWSREEASTLIALARAHEPAFAPLLMFLFSTGARRGEALGLQWGDVDFESHTLTIRRSITVRRVTSPKSGRARSIKMSPTLASELFDLLGLRRRESLYLGRPEVPT